MSDKINTDLNKLLPWAIVAVLGFMLLKNNQVGSSDVEKATSQVFVDMRKGYSDVFKEAASEVEGKKIQTDRQLLDYVKVRIEEARKKAQIPFDAVCEKEIPESFLGKEAEVSSLLMRISKSW
jgi:hypothetical protein